MKVKNVVLYVAGEGKRYFGVQRDSRLVWESPIKLSSPTKMFGEPRSPLGNRMIWMAFHQSVEVCLVHFLLKICLIGLFKVQNSLKDGNTRVLFGYAFIKFDSWFDCSLRFKILLYENHVSIIVWQSLLYDSHLARWWFPSEFPSLKSAFMGQAAVATLSIYP